LEVASTSPARARNSVCVVNMSTLGNGVQAPGFIQLYIAVQALPWAQ